MFEIVVLLRMAQIMFFLAFGKTPKNLNLLSIWEKFRGDEMILILCQVSLGRGAC